MDRRPCLCDPRRGCGVLERDHPYIYDVYADRDQMAYDRRGVRLDTGCTSGGVGEDHPDGVR